jgi:hypothetical protein
MYNDTLDAIDKSCYRSRVLKSKIHNILDLVSVFNYINNKYYELKFLFNCK